MSAENQNASFQIFILPPNLLPMAAAPLSRPLTPSTPLVLFSGDTQFESRRVADIVTEILCLFSSVSTSTPGEAIGLSHLHSIQTGCGAQLTYSVGAVGFLPRGEAANGVGLTTYLYRVSRMSGVIHLPQLHDEVSCTGQLLYLDPIHRYQNDV